VLLNLFAKNIFGLKGVKLIMELNDLKQISKLGTAKIGGLTCNKKSPMTLRIDLEVTRENLPSVLEALNLSPTDELIDSLEIAVKNLKKAK
jgi:hypothetical protein